MKINQPRQQCIMPETKASFIETSNSTIIIKDQQQSKVQIALSSKKAKEKANLDTPPSTRPSPQVPEWLARLPLIDEDNSTKSPAFKVIPQFCIAHFYCAHLITYNFIHYTYHLKKYIIL
jgi:hypothetical protein